MPSPDRSMMSAPSETAAKPLSRASRMTAAILSLKNDSPV